MWSRKIIVLRGRAAVGALMTVALALVAVSGCDTGSGAFRPPPDTEGGRPGPGAEGAPTITMIMPTTDRFVFQGDTVDISWVDTDSDDNAEVTVFAFLDDDGNQVPDAGAVTLVLQIVSEDPDGASDIYTWLTAGFPEGAYTVGATIDDFDNPPVTDFALGQVIISAQQSLTLDLGRIGTRFDGIVWRGWNSGDMAGYALDGGMDVNGDGIDDMVVISRFGDPFYFRPGAGPWGEAYLIYGQQGRLVEPEQELNSVAANISGTIYAAPRPDGVNYVTDNGSSGIMSVAMVPNVETVEEDPLAGAEILFGIPFIDGLYDELDPDPAEDAQLNESMALFCIPNQFDPGSPVEMPVLGITGTYLDYHFPDGWWWFEYTYEAPDCCPNEDYEPECDPDSGQYDPNRSCGPDEGLPCLPVYDVTVYLPLPYVLMDPGALVLNESCDGYDDSIEAIGYPLAYGPFTFSDSDDDDDQGEIPTHTGLAIIASSVGNGSTTMDGAIVDLTKVGGQDTNLYPEAWGSTWGFGAKFRPPYTHTGQDEVDNWSGWEWPYFLPTYTDLIPSDWAHSIGWADVDGDGDSPTSPGGPELLIGAPRMAHISTWSLSAADSYSPVASSAPPLLLHQGFTANVFNTSGFSLVETDAGVNLSDVQAGDKVIILHGSGMNGSIDIGTYLATGSAADRVFLDRDPGTSVIPNPSPPPGLTFANDVWYMIPDRGTRSNDEETGGIAIIGNRLWQPSGPQLAWYDDRSGTLDPPALLNVSDPFPSWPTLPTGDLTWILSLGCGTTRVNFDPRMFHYPVTDMLAGDLQTDASPTAIDPLRTTNRMIDGGQLGGVSDLADSGVTGPATSGVTGVGAYDPVTRATISDFNMDGLDDMACGAPAAHPGGLQNAGIAYLVYGARPFGWHDTGQIDNPTPQQHLPGVELEGTRAGDRTGTAQARVARYKPELQRAVDFNGDRIADWLVSAPGRDPSGRTDAGMVVVIFGHDRYHPIDGSFTLDQLNTDTNGPLGVPDGVLDGWDLRAARFIGEQPGDEAGYFVAGVGDANADGYADILISAPGHDYDADGDGSPERLDCGKVYLIYGSSWFSDPSNPTWSDLPANRSTYDLRDIGTGAFPDGLPGKSYVGPVDAGPSVRLRIGPVAGAGDVDSDGFDDYLIGSPYATQLPNKPEAGACYLIYGTPGNQP